MNEEAKSSTSAPGSPLLPILAGGFWLLSIGAVCYLSLIPEVEAPVEFTHADKLGHALAYYWLAILPFVWSERKTALVCALSMVLLGIVLEFAQGFIGGRDPSLWDIIANTVGIAYGVWCGFRFVPLNKLRRIS